MANKPTKLDIQLWIPAATDIFQSIMPPINSKRSIFIRLIINSTL